METKEQNSKNGVEDQFRLKSLDIQNYRCFKELKLEFTTKENIHIILANNMAGKTAILDALSICLAYYTAEVAIPKSNVHGTISKDDHRALKDNPLDNQVGEVSCIVDCQFKKLDGFHFNARIRKSKTSLVGNMQTDMQRVLSGSLENFSVNTSYFIDKTDFRKFVRAGIELAKDERYTVPLFDYIPTNYLYSKDSDKSKSGKSDRTLLDNKLEHGYYLWFLKSSVRTFVFNWLRAKSRTIISQGSDKTLSQFNGRIAKDAWLLVNQNVSTLLPDVKKVVWNEDVSDFVVHFVANSVGVEPIRKFDMLSDGYQYLILMVMELSVRSILLNQHLKSKACKYAEGVVLIDEFGVHLHPELQKVILRRLEFIFPKVQFIITTHSPMLLNGLKKEQIHILECDEEGNRSVRHPEEDVIGLGAEGILTEMFGLKSTFDDTTLKNIARLRELRDLVEKKTSDEEKEFSELNEAVGLLAYDGSFQDKQYQTFLDKLRSRNDERTKKGGPKLSSNEIEKLMDEVIDEWINE